MSGLLRRVFRAVRSTMSLSILWTICGGGLWFDYLYGFQNVAFVIAVLIGGPALGSALRSRIVGASVMFVVVYLLGGRAALGLILRTCLGRLHTVFHVCGCRSNLCSCYSGRLFRS